MRFPRSTRTRVKKAARVAVAIVLAMLTVGTLSVEPAPAETKVSDLTTIVTETLKATNPTLNSTITCVITTEYPHDSHHVPGTVNVRGWITCTAPVTRLDITTQLYYATALRATGANANYGQAFIQANAATSCIPGYYQGSSRGNVVFPPGYVPPTGYIGHDSPLVLVDCV